eukprot:UN07010
MLSLDFVSDGHELEMDDNALAEVEMFNKDEGCPVCLEEEPDTLLFPCSHQFHSECILQWVEHNFSCPMCRQEIGQFVPINGKNVNPRFSVLWQKHYLEGSDSGSSDNNDHNDLKKQIQPTFAFLDGEYEALLNEPQIVIAPIEKVEKKHSCAGCVDCTEKNVFSFEAKKKVSVSRKSSSCSKLRRNLRKPAFWLPRPYLYLFARKLEKNVENQQVSILKKQPEKKS